MKIAISEDTFPKLLLMQFLKHGAKGIAMQQKDRGIWRSYTWKEYYENVKYFALGLMSLGLKRGDRVSILGDNEPEWYWADLGIQAAGGITVGIFTDCMAKEVQYFASFSDSKFILAHDQEQVDKVLEIKDQLPLIERVIYWDPKGLWFYNLPFLMSFKQVLELGKSYEETHPDIFEKSVQEGNGKDTALMLYTSGTTGQPKGALVSYDNILEIAKIMVLVDPMCETDNYVSAVSPAWITEHSTMAMHLLVGFPISFPENPVTVQEDIRDIGPDLLFFAPRQLEAMSRVIQAKIVDASLPKRFLYNVFLRIAYKKADLEIAKQEFSLLSKIVYKTGYFLVYRPLRDKFGILKCRRVNSGGASVSPDIIRFYRGIGVNLKMGYGSSEGGAWCTVQRDDDIKLETAGVPCGLVEVRLIEDGQLLVRSPGVFNGYYKNPEASDKAVVDGWYLTGDFCNIDGDGHLTVMGRMSDVRGLSSGKKFSPDYVEVRLRFSPYLKDALVFGRETEDYVTAIITIDSQTVGRWAEGLHIPYTTFTDLSQKKEVLSMVANELIKVNKALPEHSRVKRFVNLNKEFDPDESEITRTRKLRRSFVEQRFKDIIDAMYSGKPHVDVQSEITYHDGRKGVVQTSLTINTVD